MRKSEVPVENAVGLALAHDLTRIVPGEFKGPAFVKGQVITERDIPLLLDIGKRHIYVLEVEDGELHENEAAIAMADALAGPGVACTDVHEGKVVLKAKYDGMLWIDEDAVFQANLIDGISLTTRRPFIHVTAGTSVAGVRPIPLVIEAAKVDGVVGLARQMNAGRPVIDVLPYHMRRAVIVTTGSEIREGRIRDKAGPVLRQKLSTYGVEVVRQTFPGDETPDIVREIQAALREGVDLVCVTGGMSVDPDDRSPASIRQAAPDVVTYGTPLLPGSMLMLSYCGDAAVFGLPGAVIFDKVTSFDVLLPRVLAGLKVAKADIARLGVGGWLNA